VAERLISAYPFRLEYLCNFQQGLSSFYSKVLLPLCWFNLGSVSSLRELPISLLNRLTMIMEDEGSVEKFLSFQHPYIKTRGR
jgi:hypothetical protein